MRSLFILLTLTFLQIGNFYGQSVTTSKEVEAKIAENRKKGLNDYDGLTLRYSVVVNGVDFDSQKEKNIITQINNIPKFKKSSITRKGEYHLIITTTSGDVTPAEFKRIISEQQLEVIDFTFTVSL